MSKERIKLLLDLNTSTESLETNLNPEVIEKTVSQVISLLQKEKNIPLLNEVLGYMKGVIRYSLELPVKAPELYGERKDKSETAGIFVRRVWGDYIDAGVLFRSDLKNRRKGIDGGLDPWLVTKLTKECGNKGLKSILPDNSIQINQKISNISPSQQKAVISQVNRKRNK